MNYIENLRASKQSKPVIYYSFIKIYPANKEKLFVFHEGKMDDKYYGPRINGYFNSEKCYMLCKGKINVIYMKEIIEKSWDYKECKRLFFVDSDFDIKINDEMIFETPCYSIENLYTQKSVLEEILQREFYIPTYSNNYKTICDLFEKLKREFHEVVLEFNSWVHYQRAQEQKNKEKKKLNLDNIPKGKLFRITKENSEFKVMKTYCTADIHKWCPEHYDLDDSDYNKSVEILRNLNYDLSFRGKQEFEFFCSFIEKIKEELALCKKNGKDTPPFTYADAVCNVSLNLSSLDEIHMEKLSYCAVEPEELKEYLKLMSSKIRGDN